ncbi:MAG: radical SAM protein [Deltaproteobacteria bacterium]|nr:radical SAM protein [Deltaproteobacteria bacterium]
MLTYRRGPESDPFHYIYASSGWLRNYDPPGEFPFWVNLEPTSRCQLDCIFCSRRLSGRPVGDMDTGMASAIFREAGGRPGAAVRFTGWGEPLLHPRIGDLAASAKREGLKLKIYTNALALTPRLFDLFMDIGVDDLQFSLQGLDPVQYEFNRRGARWEETERRILMASRRRGSRGRPFLSILTSVLATELEGHDPGAFSERWLEHVDKVAVDLTNLNFVSGTREAMPYLGSQSSGLARGKCVDVFLALEVKYDGSIQFCGQDSEARECHTVGRFGEMGLAEAWRHPRLEAQREMVGRALGHEGSPVCRNCYHNTDKYDFFKRALEAGAGAGGAANDRGAAIPGPAAHDGGTAGLHGPAGTWGETSA